MWRSEYGTLLLVLVLVPLPITISTCSLRRGDKKGSHNRNHFDDKGTPIIFGILRGGVTPSNKNLYRREQAT